MTSISDVSLCGLKSSAAHALHAISSRNTTSSSTEEHKR